MLKVDRREQLVALCRWHSVQGIVELGVLHGRTTKALLKNLPEILVWAVDTWLPGDPTRDPGPEIERRGPDDSGYRSYADVDLEAAYQGLLALEQQYPHRLQVLRMTTTEAAEPFPEASIDAIFLDADHTTEAVKADLRIWVPKVRPTGVIFGHDYGFASVSRALNDLVPGWVHHHAGVWSIPRNEVDLNILTGTD